MIQTIRRHSPTIQLCDVTPSSMTGAMILAAAIHRLIVGTRANYDEWDV